MAIHPITLEKLPRVPRPMQAELDEALVRDLLLRTKGAGMALVGAGLLYWGIVRSSAGPAASVLVGVLVFRLVLPAPALRASRGRLSTGPRGLALASQD